MKRREFLRRSLCAAFAVPSLVPSGCVSTPRKPGPNERVVVGLIGPGHRARGLLKDMPNDLKLVSLADCDLGVVDSFSDWAAKECPGILSEKPSRFQDYRQMLDKEKLDAAIEATTTHARALISIHAMQAGLDVYAEKPLTLTIEEGVHLMKAEKRYETVFQVGTQQRSIPINNFASDLVKGGAIGKVHTVLCMNFIGPEIRPAFPEKPLPQGFNWESPYFG